MNLDSSKDEFDSGCECFGNKMGITAVQKEKLRLFLLFL